jgi:hypothetical protein
MCKAFRVTVIVKDFDEIGFDANRLIKQMTMVHMPGYIEVFKVETFDIGEWSKTHELNYKITDDLCAKYFNDKTRCVD